MTLNLSRSPVAAALSFAATICAVPIIALAFESGPQPHLELTGIAVDRATNKPLEGVWVLAPYHEFRTDGILISKQDCVKTRGMMTGPDGKFHFPVEKRDGMNPASVSGIAPGYYMYTVLMPTQEKWKRQDAESYSHWTMLMEKQDPSHPTYVGNSDAFCHWARHAEDTEAADRYLGIELQEVKKYGGRPEHVEMLQRVVNGHRALGKTK